jgi:pimeloyl-ACP methyl ester carboxylesterase
MVGMLVYSAALVRHARGSVVMEDVAVTGGAIKAWSVGSGEPVLLIHGALAADVFGPMIELPELSSYRFIGYRRRGHMDSAPNLGSDSIESYTDDAVAVMDHFDVDRVHVLGHSFGGRMALELSRQAPKRVHSLSLLEGGGAPDLVVPSAPAFGARVGEAAGAYQAGDGQAAVETILDTIGGKTSREDLSSVLATGWFEQAVSDIGTLFEHEFPASWGLTSSDLESMTMPSMMIIGESTAPFFREMSEAVAAALPNCEKVMVAGVNHWLQAARPDAIAPHLAAFLNRNPMAP